MKTLIRPGPLRLGIAFVLAVSIATFTGLGLIYSKISADLATRREAIVTTETAAILNQNQSVVQQDLKSWLENGLLLYSVAGLFDAKGRPIAGNLMAVPPDLVLNGKVQSLSLPSRFIDKQVTSDTPSTVLMAGERRPDGSVFVLGRTLSEVSTLKYQIIDFALVGSAVLFLGVMALALHESRRQNNRLKIIRRSFSHVIDGALDERLPLRGTGDDLDQLAGDVNRMLDRLQQLVMEVKEVSDNIAHDLRTPLSVLRVRLERALTTQADLPTLRTTIEHGLSNLDRALGSMTSLLRLAEIENGERRAGFAVVDFVQVCQDAFDLYQPMAEERGVGLTLSAPQPLTLHGDADLLVEAVANLLDNAIKFTPEAGHITVSAWQDDTVQAVSVADTGSGFPVEERSHVGRRFYRGDKSRHHPGTGLGLSLVRAIADLHGLTLTVDDNRPKGAIFTLARDIA